MHFLRHFHSTHALDLITAVAGRKGHDPSVLLKVYSRHLEQTDRWISEAGGGARSDAKAETASACGGLATDLDVVAKALQRDPHPPADPQGGDRKLAARTQPVCG